MIFNKEGMPRTVGLSLGWTILLALFSCGLLFLPLGLYLAYWVRVKRQRSVALWGYAILAAICLLEYADGSPIFHSAAIATGVMAISLSCLIGTPLILRSELIALYRQSYGIDLRINPLLTVFFSSIYLNYCLPDMPVDLLASIASWDPGRAYLKS
jgi:hypothetical protein